MSWSISVNGSRLRQQSPVCAVDPCTCPQALTAEHRSGNLNSFVMQRNAIHEFLTWKKIRDPMIHDIVIFFHGLTRLTHEPGCMGRFLRFRVLWSPQSLCVSECNSYMHPQNIVAQFWYKYVWKINVWHSHTGTKIYFYFHFKGLETFNLAANCYIWEDGMSKLFC